MMQKIEWESRKPTNSSWYDDRLNLISWKEGIYKATLIRLGQTVLF